ncbi:MAG: transcription antitermination factor NusB [Clostridia bacterium]|nr:transcription antitermination factor NusB [Clostridia bacterium]
MKRSNARELAFKTIYSKFFNAEENDELEATDKDSLEFISKILKSFATNYDEINSIISQNLKGYTIERLYKIDLAIITLAVVELKFIKEEPKEVIINEAVELAKKYSTEKSPRFINGVLADIVK